MEFYAETSNVIIIIISFFVEKCSFSRIPATALERAINRRNYTTDY